jgi:hypothetical protein
MLPFVLGIISINSEQAAQERALQEILAAPTATAQPAGGQPTESRPLLLDQHYYFVNGCVSSPVNCGTADGETWGEYYQELRRLYDEAAASVGSEEQQPTFDQWAGEHVHFISAQTAADGAYKIKEALPQNTSQAGIHMLGTSAGGASIFSYLGQALRGDVPLDRRVRSAIAVDSPLGFQFPFRSSDWFLGTEAGAMKSDVELGIGEWSRAVNLSLFAVNTPNDIVNHETVPDVPEDAAPVYPQESAPPTPAPDNIGQKLTQGIPWHVYTGSHMAESTRQFMDEHWR